MIEAAAIDSTRPSPPITASQSQAISSLSRPSTKTCFGTSGSACTARFSAHSEARKDIVAIDPRRRREGDRERRGGADFLEQLLAAFGRQPLGIVHALRNPLGIEHHGGGHHRARQRTAAGLVAARHRPDAALDQRALAPKARRRDRDHALGQFGQELCRICRELMPGWWASGRAAQPGTGRAARISPLSTWPFAARSQRI